MPCITIDRTVFEPFRPVCKPLPKFDLQLKILDLNNVPLVTGTSYVKWHLPSSSSAEHRGHTPKSPIREHKVTWDYTRILPVRLTVDKNGMLQYSEIHFEVLQEYSPSARAERILLGNVKLNLAEFVEGSEHGEEEGVVRRYLMQESKINSTLKIGIRMRQTEGERDFIAPPLKTAPVFGGIAGIMTAEQGDGDDGSNMPSMSSKAQESGKLQDLYRRSLAASWAAQAGELPADRCIEDIFAGGDGWGDQGAGQPQTPRTAGVSTEDDSDGDKRTVRGHRRNVSGSTVKQALNHDKISSGPGGVSGRKSIEQQVHASNDAKRHKHIKMNEIDEFVEREDLRSWVISAPG
ncbi:MAG: hypothetical protein Q9217_006199 [Psora testacea]